MNPYKNLRIPAASLFMITALLCTGGLNAQTVSELMEIAVENNPELKALQSEYEAALYKGDQVSQLPDPQLGIAVPAMRPETRLGSQMLTISASQMFPWFGTLKAREDVALTMASSKYERITALRLDIEYAIRSAYDQLWLLEEQQKVVGENILIYDALERVALSKVENGKGKMSDVLRIRIKRADLEQKLNILENQKSKYYARINAAMNRPTGDTIRVTEALDSLLVIPADMEELASRIEENHPIMNQLDIAADVSEKELELNRKSGLPSFGVGLDYSLVKSRTDMDPEGNGRDILIPKVMVSIPIYRKKYAAKEQEEFAIQQSLEYRKESVMNEYTRMLYEYKSDYDDAILKMDLFRQQKQTTQSASDLLMSYYSIEGSRFEEVLQVQDQLYNYDISLLQAIVQMHIAKAGIDRLTNF